MQLEKINDVSFVELRRRSLSEARAPKEVRNVCGNVMMAERN